MEGFSQIESVDNTKSVEKWDILRAEAPMKAEKLISEIDGFKRMTYEEKIASLTSLIGELSKNNKNRFIGGMIEHERAVLEENERHRSEMTKLGITV